MIGKIVEKHVLRLNNSERRNYCFKNRSSWNRNWNQRLSGMVTAQPAVLMQKAFVKGNIWVDGGEVGVYRRQWRI